MKAPQAHAAHSALHVCLPPWLPFGQAQRTLRQAVSTQGQAYAGLAVAQTAAVRARMALAVARRSLACSTPGR